MYNTGIDVPIDNQVIVWYNISKGGLYIIKGKKYAVSELRLSLLTHDDPLIGEHSSKDLEKKLKKIMGKGSTFGEQVIMSLLQDNNVYYLTEYHIRDINRRFDFYLPKGLDGLSKPIAIEVNGLHHYSEGSTEVSEYRHRVTSISDKEKEEFCSNNNIELVFIDSSKSSYSYLEGSIRNSILSELLEKRGIKRSHKRYFDKKLVNYIRKSNGF